MGRGERVGMNGGLSTVVCCVAPLQVDPRSCHEHTGRVAGFIAFERAAHCAIGKDVIDAELGALPRAGPETSCLEGRY